MEERYVRCRRCHGVFEAGLMNCPRCGAEYVPIEAPLQGSNSYQDKYEGTQFAAPVEVTPTAPPSQGGRFGMMLGVGAIFLVAAVVIAMLGVSGFFGASEPTDPPMIYSRTPTPKPTATMPSVVNNTITALKDPDFNAHVVLRTTLAVDGRVLLNQKAVALVTTIEVDLVDRQTKGTIQNGSVRTEFRIVEGVYSQRPPNGKWVAKDSIPPYLMLLPLFGISDVKQIAYDGLASDHGAVHKIISTNFYRPDVRNMTAMDLSLYPSVMPQNQSLAVWIDDYGMPLYAEYHAWTDATDGTHLLNLLTTYTFSNIGEVKPFVTPSPSASATDS